MSSFIMLKDGSTLLTSFQIINEGPQRALVGFPDETCWSARFKSTSFVRATFAKKTSRIGRMTTTTGLAAAKLLWKCSGLVVPTSTNDRGDHDSTYAS